jgi:hypothetical protein
MTRRKDCIRVSLRYPRQSMQGDVPRCDDRVGQEEDPDSVPPLTVLGDNLVLVANPVQVPPVQSSRVVNSEDIDTPDLEIGVFELGRC